MSVSYQRISTATVEDIIFYDPAADRRAQSLGIDWNDYFRVASQEWLYQLEFGWWPGYCDRAIGVTIYKNNTAGELITGFDPTKLVKTDQTLKRLDTFKAIEIFYQSLVTDVSNVNEVDRANYKHAQTRSETEWTKAVQLSNFYDVNQDRKITKLEENWLTDPNYFNGDRRWF